jgi:hypothetical protein
MPDVKFLVEITEKGIQQYEFLSRMMYYKNHPELVIACMFCLQPI